MQRTKREQIQDLSEELLLVLKDINAACDLFLPFGVKLDKDSEEKYIRTGEPARVFTRQAMLIIDNTFKKFKLIPTIEIMETFIELQQKLLEDWQKDLLREFERRNAYWGEVSDQIEQELASQMENVEKTEESKPTMSANAIVLEIPKEIDMTIARVFLENISNEIRNASKPFILEVILSDEARNPDMNPEGVKPDYEDFVTKKMEYFFSHS